MGCAAFLFGAGVSVALFAPTMLGDVIARVVRSRFHQDHDGRLVIEELELAWGRRQRARGVKVLDRDGEEILVFNARFPSLLTVLGLQEGPQESEIDVQLARLEIDQDGVSNLEHALADRGRPFDWTEAVERWLERERPLDWDSEGVVAGEWAWSSLEIHADGDVVSVLDLRQPLEPVNLKGLDLRVFRSPGEPGADDDRAVVTGALQFADGGECRADFSRPLMGVEWSGLVAGEAVPSRLIGALLGDRGQLDNLLGERAEGSLHLGHVPSDRGRPLLVKGELGAGPVRLEWNLLLDDDAVRSPEGQAALRIEARERCVLAAEATRRLFPWLNPDPAAQGPGGITIELQGVSLSRRAGLASLSGTTTVQLGESEYPHAPTFADLGLAPELLFQVESAVSLSLPIEDGALRYDGVEMSIDEELCTFNGQHALEAGRIEAEVEVPLIFVARNTLTQNALNELITPAVTVPVRLEGTWRDPMLNVNLRVLQEALSLNFQDRFKDVKDSATSVLSDTFKALTGDG